jgi:hypothetical protein
MLLEGEAEALTRTAVEPALAGDAAALRLSLDRVLSPRKTRPVPIDLPPVQSPADASAAASSGQAASPFRGYCHSNGSAPRRRVGLTRNRESRQRVTLAPPHLPPSACRSSFDVKELRTI